MWTYPCENIAQSEKAWILGIHKIFRCKQGWLCRSSKEHPVFATGMFTKAIINLIPPTIPPPT
jgi:hypothetical protein